jgi:hypothetical protein
MAGLAYYGCSANTGTFGVEFSLVYKKGEGIQVVDQIGKGFKNG